MAEDDRGIPDPPTTDWAAEARQTEADATDHRIARALADGDLMATIDDGLSDLIVNCREALDLEPNDDALSDADFIRVLWDTLTAKDGRWWATWQAQLKASVVLLEDPRAPGIHDITGLKADGLDEMVTRLERDLAHEKKEPQRLRDAMLVAVTDLRRVLTDLEMAADR
jgi:hypothetical protein